LTAVEEDRKLDQSVEDKREGQMAKRKSPPKPLRWKQENDDHDYWSGGGEGGDPVDVGEIEDRGEKSKTRRTHKHIILGIDGTWQSAFSDVFHSNVFRLNIALNFRDATDSKNSQIFIYSSGLGTMDKIGKYSAGVFGDGFDESILQAYINLVSNYRPGDKIYIFGFSRGAVIARALTGFITHSGLLKANSTAHIEHAWNYFTHKKQKFDYASQIGSIAHQNVKIEFLGVWDTVSGPHKKDELLKRYRFTNRKLDPSIKHGVHIISVDETRRAFAPIAWSGCSDGEQVLEQIWLPGVHCDIGGGYEDAFLSTISLLTMVDKLAEYCPELSFDKKYIEQGLLPIVIKEDVVVNDEWKNFPRFSGKNARTGTEASHASAHPLIKMLMSSQVTVRGEERLYNPPYWKGAALAETIFASGSWYAQKVEAILKKRKITS
jgi:hypothetical protein